MKYLSIILLLVFVGCSKKQFCDNAKVTAIKVSNVIADRWTCDRVKVYDSLIYPLNNKICPDMAMKSVGGIVCEVAINVIVGLGSEKIAKEWSCDLEKVQADLGYASKLCALF